MLLLYLIYLVVDETGPNHKPGSVLFGPATGSRLVCKAYPVAVYDDQNSMGLRGYARFNELCLRWLFCCTTVAS